MDTQHQIYRRPTPQEAREHVLGTYVRFGLLGLVIIFSLVWNLVFAQSAWTKCADEGGSCVSATPKLYRYGQPWTPAPDGTWAPVKTLTGSVPATNDYWGDPSPGTGKQLQSMDAPVTTPVPIPVPGSTIRVASWTNNATCTITGTKVQASLQPDFAGWLQWDAVGPVTNVRITNVPNNVVLYWRAATLCGTEASIWTTPSVRTDAEFQAANLPSCAPYPVDPADKATIPYFSLRLKGGAVAWFCKLPDGSWKANGRWGPYDTACIKQAFDAAAGTDAALAKQNLAAVWSSCATATPADTEFKPLYDELVALNKPISPPPVPQYIVAKNTIYPSRPVRAITNGALGSSLTGRVAVGAPCDCSTFKSGDWCAVTGNENVATAITDQLPASAALCTLK